MDDTGKTVGSPQIPWNWSLNFTSVDFSTRHSWTVEPGYDVKKNVDLDPKLASSTQITAKLVSGCIIDDVFEHGPSYSMFGTDRKISEISLVITPNDQIEDKTRVTAWGSPSYEGGIDFHPETTPDTIVFHFYLPTADFNVLFEAIRSHEISALMLRLSNVSGFFSEWSPDIITDQIKVLSNPKDQGLDMPEEFASLKLSYGSIEKASLHAISASKAGYVRESLERLRVRENAWLNDKPDVEDSALDVAVRESNASAIDLTSIHAMLSSMRIALWVAIAVLIVMLF